jgi:hypothetical protein
VIRKFKNIASLLLLLVFLFPTTVIMEHHHEHFECKAKNEKHYHEFHEKCAVCNFDFSVFSPVYKDIISQKNNPLSHYSNNYISLYYSRLSDYSFLLRAPPVYTSII